MGEQQSTPVVSTSTYLDLSNHSLDTLHNLSQFSNLQNLNLSHNYLTTIDSLSSLCNLTSLDTSYNQLIYLPELLYLNISNLQILKSNNNQITNVSPLIVSLQSLVNLNFSRNLIQQIPDTLFSCSSLTFLNFSFNRITDVPPTIGDLVQLKALVLDHNLISHLPPSLGKCCELTMLNLGENELKELPECITLCTNLVKLYVDNNDLQKVPIQISKLQLLKELNLRSNALQVLPLEITKLTSLVMCDVGDNQFGDKFYSTEPAVTDLFERLVKYQFKTPKRKILSKKDRRLQSLTLQSSIASKTKKKVFDKTDIFSKKTLIRISENEGFSYCRVVPCKKESMNHYDAYVYDDLKTLVVWIGKESIALAGILEVEDNLLVQTINYHNATVANDPLMKAFNCQKFDSTPFDNEILFNEYINSLKLYTFYDNDRSVEMKEVEVEILTSELLQSSWSVVLETGVDIFVWVGSFSNNNERNSALLQAESLLSNSGRGKESLCFVLQGNESVFFKEYFHDLALKDTLLTPLDNVQRSVSPATEKSAKLRRSQQSPTLVSQPNQNISVVYDKKEVQSHTRHASIEVKQHLSPKHTKKLSENDLIKTDVEKVDNEQKKHVILLSKADEQTQLFTSPESVSPTSPVVNENVENNIKKEDHIPNNITDDHLIKMARRTTKKKKTAPTKNIAQIQKDLNAQTETANNINEKQNVLTFDDIMQQRQKFLDRQNKTSDNLTENIDSTINPIELPRLFQVKGQRRPIVRQVECSWESLNSGDAYIYDPGKGTKTIYQWHGKSCNRMEKGKAMDKKERIGSRQVTVEEGKEPDAFWKGLNGPPTHSLTKAEDAGKDTEVEKLVAQEISLYLLSYNKQKDLVDMQKVAAGTQKLVKGILNVQQCFFT
ncbi:Villin [Entamoeba marina]